MSLQTDRYDDADTDVVEADTATWSPARVAELYEIGNTWLHRAHPLTKLAAVLPLSVAGFAGDTALVPAILLAGAVLTLVVSRLGIIALKSLRLMAPMTFALVVIHGIVRPYDTEPLVAWGPISVNAGGLALAGTTAARIAVFVIAVTAAMATVHPKIFATALIQRGVSHKLAYAYLAGAELIPEMRLRATQILEAQQSRGFDTKGSLPRRLRTLFALLKPLLVSSLIGVEMRTLALESRGFSLPGRRTAAVAVRERGRLLQRSLLLASIPLLVLAVIW
ncbi:MAG: energy-coupling factor transporter transmembrane protein EcfT [Acidimicrobiia bacterium]|nr:energy-coupling factor transporter transmembrane protein EcfT [Acidimicrobiia bacterium]MYB44644.1 energy-coupling factor transporter transmembrane protein EcfT [Acidimicrobiia bacterium]